MQSWNLLESPPEFNSASLALPKAGSQHVGAAFTRADSGLRANPVQPPPPPPIHLWCVISVCTKHRAYKARSAQCQVHIGSGCFAMMVLPTWTCLCLGSIPVLHDAVCPDVIPVEGRSAYLTQVDTHARADAHKFALR